MATWALLIILSAIPAIYLVVYFNNVVKNHKYAINVLFLMQLLHLIGVMVYAILTSKLSETLQNVIYYEYAKRKKSYNTCVNNCSLSNTNQYCAEI